ncbi:hypothetical protein lbkm_0663 [Lachnospiraceae bacterium KM106-2]|nr:hypothetical protein lbkm_0663 [Lachnospiraceae bacterium KM106-2]
MNYYWVRIYDYKYDDELKAYEDPSCFEKYKGVMLDEYYLKGEELTRKEVKKAIKKRSSIEKFAKPRKNKDGIYALVLDSNKFFYDRFYKEIDTVCPHCGKRLFGKAADFPKIYANSYDESIKPDEEIYFCSYDGRREFTSKLRGEEGEWQNKDGYENNGGVYGYIYHIYNRSTNMHYIGQTLYMPFFRWQEHVKSRLKGDICDLVFETVTEVRVKSKEYLNNIEAWWINKYISDYGRDRVINITVPKVTINDLIKKYAEIVEGQIIFN